MLFVPEPDEILAWLVAAPRRTWVYLAATERQPLWLIVAVTALLGLAQLDLIPLGLSEAGHLSSAVAYEAGDAAASQAGLFSRIISGPLNLSRDPRHVAGLVAGLNIMALIVLYEAVGRFSGWRVAVLCCSLLGAAPWLALLTREIEPPGLVIALCSLSLAGLLAGLSGLRPWGWTVAWMSALLMAVLSPDGFPALCAVASISALWHRRVHWSYALLGVLLGVLLTLSAQYDHPANTIWSQAALFLSSVPETSPMAAGSLASFARLLGGAGLELLVSNTPTPLAEAAATLSTWGGWAAVLCVPMAAWLGLSAWARWREQADAHRYAIPVVWVAVTLTLYLVRGSTVSVGQLASLLPVSMLAAALTIDHILARLARTGRSAGWVLTVIVTLVLVAGAYRSLSLYGQVDAGNASEAYGTPLKRWHLVTTLVTRTASDDIDPLWVVSSGSRQEQDERAAVIDYLLGEQTSPLILQADRQPAILLPAERGARYLLLGDTPLQRDVISDWQGELAGLVSSQGRAYGAQLYRVPEWPVDRVLSAIQQREWAAWDAGIRLVGYDLPALALYDRALVFATYWTFEEIPLDDRDTRHRLSLTLYDAQGVPMTVYGEFGMAEEAWKPGLLLKLWHVMPIAYVPVSEPITIHLMIDRGEGGYRNLVIDDLGRPTSDRHILGPFELAD
jgi:hypothetical protein